jgi:hypothetical protein
MLEINLILQVRKMQKFIDTRVNTFRKTWSNYRKTQKILTLQPKRFWRSFSWRLERRMGRLVWKLKEEVFDFTTLSWFWYQLFRLTPNLKRKMIMHQHRGSVANYERHLDRAMDVMKKYDYPAVKNGLCG